MSKHPEISRAVRGSHGWVGYLFLVDQILKTGVEKVTPRFVLAGVEVQFILDSVGNIDLQFAAFSGLHHWSNSCIVCFVGMLSHALTVAIPTWKFTFTSKPIIYCNVYER